MQLHGQSLKGIASPGQIIIDYAGTQPVDGEQMERLGNFRYCWQDLREESCRANLNDLYCTMPGNIQMSFLPAACSC